METFLTGAIRSETAGRGSYELLPARAIMVLAKVFEAGADQHGSRNWERGIPISRIVQSALRHSFQFLAGETDEKHAEKVLWNWSVIE